MPSLVHQLQQDLLADPALAVHVEERIYDRPLKKAGFRSTPEAFDPETGMVRLSLVVVDDGVIGEPFRDDAGIATVTVWIHGPGTTAARETMDGPIYDQVVSLLEGDYVGPNGTGVEISVGDRFGIHEDPSIENALVDYIRFTIARLWR